MMDTEMMALGFIMSGPKTGYQLKTICGKMIIFYSITLNQIYPTIRKLEANGYIRKKVVIQTGKPNKHLYSITPSGKKYFLEKLMGPSIPSNIDVPFLRKQFFFRFLNNKQVSNELQKEINSIDEQLAELASVLPDVQDKADEHGRFIYDTTILLLQTLQDAYSKELQKWKGQTVSKKRMKTARSK